MFSDFFLNQFINQEDGASADLAFYLSQAFVSHDPKDSRVTSYSSTCLENPY